MSDQKFTPGPWMARYIGAGTKAWGVVAANGKIVVEYGFVDESDARLIATAPDLLEELRELVQSVEDWNRDVTVIIGRPPNSGMATTKAHVAIAKAECR